MHCETQINTPGYVSEVFQGVLTSVLLSSTNWQKKGTLKRRKASGEGLWFEMRGVVVEDEKMSESETPRTTGNCVTGLFPKRPQPDYSLNYSLLDLNINQPYFSW